MDALPTVATTNLQTTTVTLLHSVIAEAKPFAWLLLHLPKHLNMHSSYMTDLSSQQVMSGTFLSKEIHLGRHLLIMT